MLREFLKLGATCAALAVFFTPLEAARKITRERNVGALTPVPFGAIALNCSIWVVYGIIVRDWVPLVASNAVGSASGVYCLGVFARHAKPPLQLHARRLRTGVVGGFACLLFAARGAMWRGVDKAAPAGGDLAAWDAGLLELVGRVGVGACVAMFASPLSTIRRVLSTRSTASMAPSVTLASAACSLLWTLYGRDIGDLYVWGPNVAGLAFSLAQLGLFGIFGMPPAPADMSGLPPLLDIELAR